MYQHQQNKCYPQSDTLEVNIYFAWLSSVNIVLFFQVFLGVYKVEFFRLNGS